MKIKREDVQRSGRQRKRPSFFQDFENEENNLDKILDEFEQQQLEESQNPKPKQEKKTPKSSRPRRKRELIHDDEEEDHPIELETTRSGKDKYNFSNLYLSVAIIDRKSELRLLF
jgi:hypothetical protein